MPLADLCDEVQYGYTASASVEPIGPKFLRITDIVGDTVSWAEVPYCVVDEEKSAKYRLNDGDIVVARTGATVGYAKHIRNPPPSVFASYLVRFRVGDAHNARFVGAIIESDVYKAYIKAHAGGAAQPNANAKVLGSFPVPVPPIRDQDKIAAVLAAYDELIENNLRRIEILEKMAQAIYREWFVKLRYPDHEADDLVDSPLGPIPPGWEASTLGESNTFRLAKPAVAQYDGTRSYLATADVRGFHERSAGTQSEYAELPSRAQHVPVRNSVWFGRMAEYQKVMLFLPGSPDIGQLVLSSGFACVECENESWAAFMASWILSDSFEPLKAKYATGATQVSLTDGGARQIPILVPPETLVQAFGSIVVPILELALTLRRQNSNLRVTRDLILPKLVSGEIDVSDLDIDTSWLVA